MIRLSSSLARRASFSWRTIVHLRLGIICVAVLVGTSTLAGAASSSASAGKFSARLSKTTFTASQAGSVKLVCTFPKKSGSFSYLLTLKKGKKWQTVKAVKKVSYRKGSHTMTVKKVFAGKAVKLGSYRLKVSAGSASKLLRFTVAKTKPVPPPPTGSAPTNTSLPTISGTVKQGQTLSASNGVWTGSPTAYAYRWDRCTASGAICTDIGGATSSTYALIVGDVGSTIRIVVTASNSHGSTSATSSQTAVVIGLPPVSTGQSPANTALPTISGTARDGQTLTTSDGSWTGSPTPSLTHQWLRCDASGINCTGIASATASSYALVPADDHSTIRVQVTASNSQGSAAATSAQTGAVSAIVTGTSSGGKSSCAVLSDGKVECWGENEHGQLGDGTTTSSATPVQVSGITNAVHVSVGGDHACALLSDHSVKCWGVNTYGQLGNGATLPAADSDTPVQVYSSGTTPLTGVAQVSAGNIHTCALLTGGTLECWGYDGSGELGNGATNSNGIANPVPVYQSGTSGSLFSNVTQVSAGDQYTCAVAGGNGYCWGSDSDRTLGYSDTYDQYNPNPVSTITSTSGYTVGSVNAGANHACAVIGAGSTTDPGTVWCWGNNGDRQLGTPSGGAMPAKVVAPNDGPGYLTGATAVSAGKWHTCAIVSGGVDCWGGNSRGQRGNPAGDSEAYSPFSAIGISTATALSSGEYFSCALLAGGTVDCWGDNTFDQLGTGKIGSSQAPLTVSGLPAGGTLSHVSVGGEHVCALDSSDGSVWCWGRNNFGQLGNGGTSDSSTPVEVKTDATHILGDVTQISAGAMHACALVEDNSPESSGKIYCWGYNYAGQLGNGSVTGSPYAGPVYSSGTSPSGTVLEHVIQVSAGDFHTCTVVYGGSAWCWGNDAQKQLGDNLVSNSSNPVQVRGVSGSGYLAGVTQVSAGASHSCAVSGGYAYCWGSNGYGQIGVNLTANPIPYPMEVWAWNGTGITFLQAASVSAGSDSSCAVDSSGYAYCWGHNYFGQLGNGVSLPSPDKRQPVQVYASGASPSGTLLTNVSQISVGPEHACVHVSIPGHPTPPISLPHNNAYCWGYNNTGQLGNGTLDDSSNPVTAISTIFGVTEVSAGGSDNDGNGVSCAMVSGSVECWGSNYYGQMGSPALPTSVDPVAVVGLP